MIKQIVTLLTLGLAISCCISNKKKHPRDVWVFRSVLDEMPRMITAALDEKDFYIGHGMVMFCLMVRFIQQFMAHNLKAWDLLITKWIILSGCLPKMIKR